jgi:hypothetical protein
MIFGGGAFLNSQNGIYRSSRLLAEHGSAYAMFNAPDPINDPSSRMPLGYYITRVQATKAYNTGRRDYLWWTYVDDMLEMAGPEKFASCVFQAVLEEAHLNLDTPIVMPKNNINTEPVSAREISRRYQNLYGQWKERVGEGLAFKSILADIGYLDDVADRLCKKNDTNIVIFGHCHDCELDKDSWFVKERIYANCGAWCDTHEKRWTFAEVETLREKKKRWVRIWEWKGEKLGKIIKGDNVNL